MPSRSSKRNAHESSTRVAGGRPAKKMRRRKSRASSSRTADEDTDESQDDDDDDDGGGGGGEVDSDGHDADDENRDEDADDVIYDHIHTDNFLDFRQLKHSIDLEDALDLREPLGRRAHLERLIESRWQTLYHRQRQGARQSGTEAAEDDENDEVQMIIQHLSSSVVPFALRWPLPVSQVPQPSWSLADELGSIVERAFRARHRRSDERSNIGRDDDDDDDDNIEQSEDNPDEPAPSLVLPVIARCQAALNSTLHGLAHRILPSGGQIHARRRDVITWRDVLKTVEMQDSVPSEVIARTESRLRSIFGSSEVVPGAAIVSTFGTSNWRRNRLRAALMDEEPIDERLCEFHESITRKRARRQGTYGRDVSSKMEAELLIRKPSHALVRRLDDPPKPRRQFFHEARADV